MDRATRKANLKKLQLPGTGSQIQQRKTRQSATTTTSGGVISNHFLTLNGKEPKEDTTVSPPNRKTIEDNKSFAKLEAKTLSSKPKATRAKRTKLDDFVFKTPHTVSTELQIIPKTNNDDDFDLPKKKAKKVPPITMDDNAAQTKTKKPSRKKKQTTIKSAFLRNEQLFAEIAAQHCAADNFDGDDIQLAIAISKSEAESKGIEVIGENDLVVDDDGAVKNVENDKLKAEKIRQKLEKYGFRTAEQNDYHTFAAAFMPQAKARRAKSKWANKFTALTLRDDQLQNKKLQQKIEALLNQQFRTKPLAAAEQQHLTRFVLQSALLRKHDTEMKEQIIHLSKNPQVSNELYFVAELFEINKLPPGYLLKDWNAIQGRDLTPKKRKHNNAMELKLHGIYAELEEYFQRLKTKNFINDSVTSDIQLPDIVTKENDDKVVENIKEIQIIANEMPSREENLIKSADLHETCDVLPKHLFTTDNNQPNSNGNNEMLEQFNQDSISVTDTTSITTSSTGNNICNIISPTKSLDLINVSNSSLNIEHNIELTSELLQVNDLNRMKVSCTSMKLNANNKIARSTNDKISLNNLETNSDLSSFVTKEKPASSKSNGELMDISSYSLGIEALTNVKQITCDTAPLREPCNSKSHQTGLNSTKNNNLYDLNLMQVSSSSINTQTFVNTSSQITRSNSPDIFADSDMEMEDNDNAAEVTTTDANLYAKSNNSSLSSFDGVTTYEIYSSDEVKNTSSLVKPNLLTDLKSNEMNVIDLTQDNETPTQNGLNHSKPIVEVELFGDTPPQHENDNVIDIDDNNHDDGFKFTLSPCKTNVLMSPAKEAEHKSLLNHGSLRNTEVKDINELLDDDVVLHEIEMNQTNMSFLDFQGSKQLETCFHRETANERTKLSHNETNIIATAHKKSLPGNDTIFRELYSKYLGSSSTTQNQPKHKVNDSVLNHSFTHIMPRVNNAAPKHIEYGTQFTMDFNMTIEHNINQRRSLSFVSKTPEKSQDLSICKFSKSQSFTKQNISIDLTQNEDSAEAEDVTAEEENDDDDCLVLSDDEINYSIWNANKTGHLDEMEESANNADFGKDNDKERKKSISYELPRNSSLLDFYNKELSPPTSALLSQQSYSDFDAKYLKTKESHSSSRLAYKSSKNLIQSKDFNETYSNCNPLLLEDRNNQLKRSNFGILEEFSQPIDFTPNSMCTPTKALENVSFLVSPTENSAAMKRFSSFRKSAHQLNDLVNHLDIESPMYNILDDYDEFDIQIDRPHGSNKTTTTTVPKVLEGFDFQKQHYNSNKATTTTLPQGLDQLLTAEISFENLSDKSPQKKNNFSIDSDNMDNGNRSPLNTYSLKEKTKYTTYPAGSEKHEIFMNNKTYTIRHTHSPKPDYTLYSEAELLKALYNFGIKPLKRKQAVKMLEYIYLQTHPIIVYDDDLVTENLKEDCGAFDKFDKAAVASSSSMFKSSILLSPPKGSMQLLSQNYLNTQSNAIPSFTMKPTVEDSDNCDAGKKLNLHDASGGEMLRYSLDLKTELAQEQYILQTNVTKKTPQPLMPFHIAWFNLVCSNPNLHENILMYEPIDLQEVYLFLKGLGYRYDPKDLKQFFDGRCIIFRYDLAAAGGNNKANGTNRHVRKKKSANRKVK